MKDGKEAQGRGRRGDLLLRRARGRGEERKGLAPKPKDRSSPMLKTDVVFVNMSSKLLSPEAFFGPKCIVWRPLAELTDL